MRGLKFPPNKAVEPVEVPDVVGVDAFAQVAAMRSAIGCSYIELVTLTPAITLIVDEEFLMHGEPAWNRIFAAGPGMVHEGHCFHIAGTALAFHNDRAQGELCSLTVEDAQLLFSLIKGGLTTAPTTMGSVDSLISLLKSADMHWQPTSEQLAAWLIDGVRWG